MKLQASFYIGGSAMLRKTFAKMFSCVIEGQDNKELPYKPNENDDYYWTLDSGNDWKVKFSEEEPDKFEIIYQDKRNGRDHEGKLVAWLMVMVDIKEIQ